MPSCVSPSRLSQSAVPAPPRADVYAGAGVEPPLREVFADPVVHAVMRRDRIGPDDVWAAVRAARRALADGAQEVAHEAPSQVL